MAVQLGLNRMFTFSKSRSRTLKKELFVKPIKMHSDGQINFFKRMNTRFRLSLVYHQEDYSEIAVISSGIACINNV